MWKHTWCSCYSYFGHPCNSNFVATVCACPSPVSTLSPVYKKSSIKTGCIHHSLVYTDLTGLRRALTSTPAYIFEMYDDYLVPPQHQFLTSQMLLLLNWSKSQQPESKAHQESGGWEKQLINGAGIRHSATQGEGVYIRQLPQTICPCFVLCLLLAGVWPQHYIFRVREDTSIYLWGKLVPKLKRSAITQTHFQYN